MLELYDRILQETKRNGLDGNKIGQLLGLKKSPLTDWKNGKSIPTTEQIIKLCDIFAVSADYLLFGNNKHLSADEQTLISQFQYLSDDDKKEILNLIEFKIYKAKEKAEILSNSEKRIEHKVV